MEKYPLFKGNICTKPSKTVIYPLQKHSDFVHKQAIMKNFMSYRLYVLLIEKVCQNIILPTFSIPVFQAKISLRSCILIILHCLSLSVEYNLSLPFYMSSNPFLQLFLVLKCSFFRKTSLCEKSRLVSTTDAKTLVM